MKIKLKIITIFLIATMLIPCSNRLVGTWTIQRYDTAIPGQKSVTLYNIGTLNFQRDGSVLKKINYDISGVNKDEKLLIKWTTTDSSVTIKSEGSKFGKTWIFLENKRRFKKLRTTNDSNQVQILELKKREITSFIINTDN